MSSRKQNEDRFDSWEELPGGRRLYCKSVTGRLGWMAKYFKEVDQQETTVKFWQEVYNREGKLIEIHEKFPVDKGHRKV